MLIGCGRPTGTETAGLTPPATDALAMSRRQLDSEILNWCFVRKGLPGTEGTCACLSDQLHVQRLPDEGARELVQVLYSVGPGSDPPFERLAPAHRARLGRAAELCGTVVP